MSGEWRGSFGLGIEDAEVLSRIPPSMTAQWKEVDWRAGGRRDRGLLQLLCLSLSLSLSLSHSELKLVCPSRFRELTVKLFDRVCGCPRLSLHLPDRCLSLSHMHKTKNCAQGDVCLCINNKSEI